MPRLVTHGRSGPLAHRLEEIVSRARESRVAEIDRRRHAGELATLNGFDPPTCRECGIFLLPKEADICRHCAANLPRVTS